MLSIIRGKIARIFSRSMSTSRILAFFCSTFSLSNLWLFTDDLQKVCFDPYKSEKITFAWMTLISVLCHVSPNISVLVLLVCSKLEWHKTLSLDILMFIATLYSHCWGVLDNLATLGTVNVQVVHMWRHASKITIWCICEIDSRRQCLTARSIRGLRPISSRTVRNRLRERHIRPRRPAICPILLPRYRAARLTWCRRHLKFRRQDWANILFRDESRFHLDSSDGRSEFTGA
jgi:hypothetical protein